MANRIDTALDALAAQFAELVAAGTLAAVRREWIVPAQAADVPVLGLWPDRFRRQGATAATRLWTVDCLLMLLTRSETQVADQTVTDLIAAVSGKIDEFNAADGPGGVADMPTWEIWMDVGRPTVPCGAIGGLRLRVDGILLIT